MAAKARRAPVKEVIRYFEGTGSSEPDAAEAQPRASPTQPDPGTYDEGLPGHAEVTVEYGYQQSIDESREVAEVLEGLRSIAMSSSHKRPAPEPPVLPGTPLPTQAETAAVHDLAKPFTSRNDLRLSPLHYDSVDPRPTSSQISPKSALKSSSSDSRTPKSPANLHRTSFSEVTRDRSNRSSQDSNDSSPSDFNSPSRWTSEADEFSLGSSNPSYGPASSRRSRRTLLNYAVFWGFAVAQMVVAIVLFAVGAVDLILKHGSVECSSNHYTIYAACIAPGVWAPVLFISAAVVGIKVGPERKEYHDVLIVVYLILSPISALVGYIVIIVYVFNVMESIVVYLILSAISALVGYIVIIVYVFNVVQSLQFDAVEMTMVPASSLIILFVEANLFLVSTIKTARVLGTHYKSRRIPVPMQFVRQKQREVERHIRQQDRLKHRHQTDCERRWVMGTRDTLLSIHGNLFARDSDVLVTRSIRPSLDNLRTDRGGTPSRPQTYSGEDNPGLIDVEARGWT